MKFNDPNEVDMVTYQMKLADYPRSTNRALINNLFNGAPPYSAEEVQANNISVNVNFLESTSIGHEARSQFYGAFLKPGRYFKCTTDAGPVHHRNKRSTIVTKEINAIMKKSLPYFECFRSKFASDVLHGIGPAVFRNSERWCPQPIGIDDVMIPANTLLTMENLPFFAIYRSYTAPELIKLTQVAEADPGWNKGLVESILKYVDKETMALMGNNWPEVWSPEKSAERIKGDGGFYVGDQVPTVDVWDFYFWNDDKDQSGWSRRMILDSWSTPSGEGRMSKRTGDLYDQKREFLYNSGDRKFADQLSSIVNFQFADLSAVAPFRYHSVRSLGFLLYATSHLQNRLRCKFNEAVFESLMMYFRVKNMDDAQRALKVELANRGFIDESIQFIPPGERWQVNANLVQLGIQENSNLIGKHSASYTASSDGVSDRVQKTKFEKMAEVNQMTALVGSALIQAYSYQSFEYREIFRRFCKKNSSDPDVREFQARCLKQGVPEKLLTPEAWDQEPERVMGQGNKTLEMAIAEQLMQYRPLFDPEPQREILRDVTLAITDDPARAEALVPQQPQISDSIHDGQLRFGTLMQGVPVSIKSGTIHTEIVESLLGALGMVVQRIEQGEQQGQLARPEELLGINNTAQHISQEIQVIAQDQNEKSRVKQYGDALGKMMNLVKAFQQHVEEAQQQASQNGQSGGDPKEQAKLQGLMMLNQAKAQNTRESHAQKTAQRQIQFQMDQKRDDQRLQFELKKKSVETGLDLKAGQRQAALDTAASRLDLRHQKHSTIMDLKHQQHSANLDLQAKEDAAKLAEEAPTDS